MQLRIARHTNRLEALVAFYRDGLGFTDRGGFEDHAGYRGAFLQAPGAASGTHLEFTEGGEHPPPDAHPESLLALYLEDVDAVRAAVDRCGGAVVASANPYWDASGAVTILDPDDFRVVLVPGPWTWATDG